MTLQIDKKVCLKMYEQMLTIRSFEEKAIELFEHNLIRGNIHPCIGQEAVSVGACSPLHQDDFMVNTHRGHGNCIAKGASLNLMMAELLGKSTGYCKGKGGSMHIADFEGGNLGANGIVGGGIPIAVGAGISIQNRGTDQVVVCFFGDGASNMLIGEDIGRYGGIFGVTKGLLEQFGPHRVRSTPISESAIIGSALGAAMTGIRTVAEIMYVDFAACAMDQIINQVAKMRYMSGGKAKVPLVIRTQGGGGRGNAAQHSQSLEALFLHIPGLKIVTPSTPYDARGLLKTAIRDDNPVIFIEHKLLYATKGPIPDGEFFIPFGQADIKRIGKDVTIVAVSYMVTKALKVANHLAGEGIDAEVIDLRTLFPLDMEILLQSIQKTNRAVIVHEGCRKGGIGAEIASQIQEEAFDFLDAPIERAGTLNVPVPYSEPLENAVIPDEEDIFTSVQKVLYRPVQSKD